MERLEICRSAIRSCRRFRAAFAAFYVVEGALGLYTASVGETVFVWHFVLATLMLLEVIQTLRDQREWEAKAEDECDVAMVRAARAEGGETIPWERVKADLGL